MDMLTVIGYLLLLAGFVLAVVEMMIPGFGAPGISAAICFVAAVGMISDSVETALTLIIVILVVLAVLLTICLILIRRRKNSPLVLQEQMKAESGKISSEDLTYLIGREGRALSDLRPAGTGKFDGVEFDVRAEGHFIESGTPIRITRISGSTLCVRAIEN